MGCCGQTTSVGVGVTNLNTDKRVHYTKGMLLGVDDFVQEQAWGMARRHELARELIGYGTARGLQIDALSDPQEVRVSPGMAWTPSGTPVCVSSEQCAHIPTWLGKNAAAVRAALPGDANELDVYVVLAYEGVPTDKVPVPGEPCRSDDALMAHSRIADCFQLTLRLRPPPQQEEDAIRDFVDWLAQVPVETGSPPMSEGDFLQQMRDAAHDWLAHTSPAPTDHLFGSPPAGMEATDGLMRAALRLWVTELRPIWRARYGCDKQPLQPGTADDAVLLARLKLNVSKVTLEGEVIGVDETDRPMLLSLRLLQELITQNAAPEAAQDVSEALAFGLLPDVGVSSDYARADHEHGTPTLPGLSGDVTGEVTANTVVGLRGKALAEASPAELDALVFNADGEWAPTPLPQPSTNLPHALVFGAEGDAGSATDFARSDHEHPMPALPPLPALAGDTSGAIGSNTVVALQGVPVANTRPLAGQILVCQAAPSVGPDRRPQLRWVPAPAPSGGVTSLGGDVDGAAGSNTIEALQGHKLDAKTPQAGDVLTFNGEAWVASQAGGVSVIAAGLINLLVSSGQFKQGSARGNTEIDVPDGQVDGGVARLSIVLRGVQPETQEKPRFVVMLTPIVADPRSAVQAFLSRPAVTEGKDIHFELTLLSRGEMPDGEHLVQFQVSRFTPARLA